MATGKGLILLGILFLLLLSDVRAQTPVTSLPPYDTIMNTFTMEVWINPTARHSIDWESTSGTDGVYGENYVVFPPHGDWTWGDGHAGAGISAGTNGVSVYEHASDYMPALLVWEGTVKGLTHVVVVYRSG